MANMSMFEEWGFRVTKAEMLLILRALGGRIATSEEREAAKELGDRLTLNRIKEMEQVTEHLRRNMGLAGAKLVDER